MRVSAGLALLVACTGSSPTVAPNAEPSAQGSKADPAYAAAVNLWHSDRIANLTAPDGWLSLAGLFWLEEDGLHEVGSDDADTVRLPRSIGDVGTIRKAGKYLTFTAAAGADVKVGDRVLVGSVDLLPDIADGGPTRLVHNGVTFYVVEREGRFGVRVKDPEAPGRTHFAGIPRYDVDPSLRITAKLTPHKSPVTLSMPSVIGTVSEEPSPGLLSFTLQGQEHWLHPVLSGKRLFIVFGDLTNGPETYGGGRFLTAHAADADGNVELDFNKAINPPCAFTAFATCPLPPPENKLNVRIPAGEKTPAGAEDH